MPDNHHKRLSRTLRCTQTDAEFRLWRHLRNRHLSDMKFRRQYPVRPYIVDFICLDRALIVEVDGGLHVADKPRDERRTGYLELRGYRVLRFWNNDVLRDTQTVLLAIFNALTPTLSQRERESK